MSLAPERPLDIADEIRTEADVLRWIEVGRGDASFTPRFLDLLDERQIVYAGADTATTTRLRGALIRALAHRALPDAALPFVLSELESAFDPWLTAVAAHALRKRPEPSPSFVRPLLDAILYIRHRDDRIRLDCHGGYGDGGVPTTALTEIVRTLGWLGASGRAALPRLRELASELTSEEARDALREAISAIESGPEAACEPTNESAIINVSRAAPGEILALRLQDQSGAELAFGDFFSSEPAVVVFFFTRCGNPAKCPLTISKLGRLQARLTAQDSRVRTAAITYDPAYDDPRRLSQYARSWGARTGESHRFFRTLDDLAPLRAHFELGVSYGAASVNQHQLEAFVLDREGTIVRAVRRRRWDESEILAATASLT